MTRAALSQEGSGPPGVVVARGARATEDSLLSEIEARAEQTRRNPSQLALPLRVLVPSRSLRDHLSARVVRRLGGGAAGLVVHTLRACAFEILRRDGQSARGGDLWFPILVRQLCREEAALRSALDALQDGYGPVAATVGDLLDAGFEIAHAEAVDEWIDATLVPAVAERIRDIFRVTARIQETLASRGLEHRSGLFRRACEVVERKREAALPARALLVHGFADVTGVQLDLLATLVRHAGARVWVARPDDPAEPDRPDPGAVFADRLLGRLVPLAGSVSTIAATPPSAAPVLLRAPGAQAEVRAVAERVRALLDEGVVPEEIGLVARDLTPYAPVLQVQLRRLAIPFSGGAGGLEPAARPVRALLDLLQRRSQVPVDRWLDASAFVDGRVLHDLRLALHGIGLGRLGQVADLDVGSVLDASGRYPLPVRRGLASAPVEADDGAVEPEAEREEVERLRAVRRRIPRETLEVAVGRARSLRDRFGRWHRNGRLGAHLEDVRQLLGGDLGWGGRGTAFRHLVARLDVLEAELGSDLPLSFDGFVLLLDRALRDVGRTGLGGAGGGVQVLSVVEARARTFEHLFVLGMNRDTFPRLVSEDPLLPDRVRRALEELLPDIPIKQRGFAEERYLFAQLCSASPRVTLSWQAVSDDGKERPPSPLIERLRLSRRPGAEEPEAPLVPPLYGPLAVDRLRPPHEHAVQAGLVGDGRALEEAFARALGSSRGEAAALARARLAAAAEIDSVGRGRPDLGPYFGLVGSLGPAGDPRAGDLYVTALESVARCGWRAFLERALGLEPVPDALAALPDITPLLIGQLLHRVLERVVVDAGGVHAQSLREALARGPVTVPWPDDSRLRSVTEELAERLAREEGIVLRGFAPVLARCTFGLLARAAEIDWGDRARREGVFGAELEGAAVVAGDPPLRVRFRADRVDRSGDGLALTDYKAGRALFPAKTEAKRREQLRHELSCGRSLQAAAYVLHEGAPVLAGRYLFVRPDLEVTCAEVGLTAGDEGLREVFAHVVRTLSDAWQRGGLVPRFLERDLHREPRACASCDVATACLRGETGARRRLATWLDRHHRARPEHGDGLAEGERSLLDAFWLGEPER